MEVETAVELDVSANEDESNAVEKILSVYWKRGRLGASYFNCNTFELFILSDVVDVRPDFNVLKNLVSFVGPTETITFSNMPDFFTTALQNCLLKDNNDLTADNSTNLRLITGSRAELSLDACKRTILTLRMEFEEPNQSPEQHDVLISSLIDMEQESMVISIALLTRHLEKYLPNIILTHSGWSVFRIQHIRLDSVVFVDDYTRRALQVFSSLQHPSTFLRGIRTHREGLSLLSLFGRCRSSDGMRRMREILVSPTRDKELLNSRLDAIAFFCLPHSQQVVASLNHSIAKVRSVSGILTRLCQTHGSVYNWQTLYSSIYNAILIGRICSVHSAASKLFATVAENVSTEVHEVAHCIDKVVDFEDCTRKTKFSVRNGIDKNLDAKRQLYAQVPEVLLKIAELELKDLPDTILHCSIVCITELGYLLCVPAWLDTDADSSLYHLPDFDVKFVVNKHVYYKTPRCSDLDRILGDLVAQMSRVESDIMVMLLQFIRRRIPAILKAVGLIADLDCILAMAEVARQNNYVRPELVDECRLDIVNGRHPLQELCVDRFVPNDAHFSAESGIVKLLTGPNASGKSVYLKQVALIAYLGHVGSFVPADKATIGLMDHIRTRIQTVETCASHISAFYIDLTQMLQCLYSSTRNSLLVIDEFGKGTTELDGQSLLIACLNHFLQRGLACPMILASTHFHRVPRILPTLLEDPHMLTLLKMAYVRQDGQLVCLHKVEEGEAGSSFALLAAKAAGLSEQALRRSFTLLNNPQQCYPNTDFKITKRLLEDVRIMKDFFNLESHATDQPEQENTANFTI